MFSYENLMKGKVEQRFKFCHSLIHTVHKSHCIEQQNLGLLEGFDLVTSIRGTQTWKVYVLRAL